MESLGEDAACVLLRLQVRFLHWLHLLLLGFGLHIKYNYNNTNNYTIVMK